MRIFRGVHDLPEFQNGVLTIGTFDGVHTGHQEILRRLKALADEINGESILLTFHPHPRLVIDPEDRSLKLLNTLDEKIRLLQHYGLDNIVIAPFSLEFSHMHADQYVKDFLWGNFHPSKVVIGYNHHFGRNREGNIDLMRKLGRALGFEVVEIEKQIVDHIGVSSTKIRNALNEGDIETATSLLGHHYSMRGTVVKGDSLGKQIGFPTANLLIDNPNKLIPADGVYAVKVQVDGKRYGGMSNIGLRPTFNGKNQRVEVHIFDFDRDIYGMEIAIELIGVIRKEIKFDSKEELAAQLKKDKATSLEMLNQKTGS